MKMVEKEEKKIDTYCKYNLKTQFIVRKKGRKKKKEKLVFLSPTKDVHMRVIRRERYG